MKAKYSTFWSSTNLLQPSKAFLQLKGDPEIFGWLTQLCTMHGFNTYYYFHFNITNRDWDCECSDVTPQPNGSREHILLCSLYAGDEHREFLSPISRLHEPMSLLGSDKGFLAMVKFPKLTGALTSNGRPYSPPALPSIPSEVDTTDITDEEPPD